jgi:hypothetical protein
MAAKAAIHAFAGTKEGAWVSLNGLTLKNEN